MRVAFVDGSAAARAELEVLLRHTLQRMGYHIARMEGFSGVESFFAAWQPERYDLVIMETALPDGSAVEAARRLRQQDPRVMLVFCSQQNDLAAESYQLGAGYYLRKPVAAQQVEAMLRRMPRHLAAQCRTLTLPDGQQTTAWRIMFTEYFNHVVTLHMRAPEETLRIRTSQGAAEAALTPEEGFFSPTQGVIVNLAAVERLEKDSFVLRDGYTIHIARRRLKEARLAREQFCSKLP